MPSVGKPPKSNRTYGALLISYNRHIQRYFISLVAQLETYHNDTEPSLDVGARMLPWNNQPNVSSVVPSDKHATAQSFLSFTQPVPSVSNQNSDLSAYQ